MIIVPEMCSCCLFPLVNDPLQLDVVPEVENRTRHSNSSTGPRDYLALSNDGYTQIKKEHHELCG